MHLGKDSKFQIKADWQLNVIVVNKNNIIHNHDEHVT